jgi:hypothetical protein
MGDELGVVNEIIERESEHFDCTRETLNEDDENEIGFLII